MFQNGHCDICGIELSGHSFGNPHHHDSKKYDWIAPKWTRSAKIRFLKILSDNNFLEITSHLGDLLSWKLLGLFKSIFRKKIIDCSPFGYSKVPSKRGIQITVQVGENPEI